MEHEFLNQRERIPSPSRTNTTQLILYNKLIGADCENGFKRINPLFRQYSYSLHVGADGT